ncbi:MAG: cytochrome c [Gammaproteobacteria bacterium]|nr:cytochrome c [Gammaproteobacteria bacterium]
MRRIPDRSWVFIALLAAMAGLWAASARATAAAATEVEAGRQVFQSNCIACHTVGGGDLVGPDLKGVTARRPREWLERWIAVPARMLAQGDPTATALLHRFHEVPMPDPNLSAGEIAAVLAYLGTTVVNAPASTGTAAAPIGTVGTPAVAPGDPAMGKKLFDGTVRFRNGGPSCMACHSVAGIGALGGGQLGPDLTTAVQRYGGLAGLSAFVGGSPTPTMNAVWARTPLTADERADVVSFLAQASVNQRPVQLIGRLAGLSVLGLLILLAITGWIWRPRLRDGVRRPMIAARRPAGGGAAIRTKEA